MCKLDNATKTIVLDRLYKTSSICSFCKSNKCSHGGNRQLPDTLKTEDVLKAINLDEYFFKE